MEGNHHSLALGPTTPRIGNVRCKKVERNWGGNETGVIKRGRNRRKERNRRNGKKDRRHEENEPQQLIPTAYFE